MRAQGLGRQWEGWTGPALARSLVPMVGTGNVGPTGVAGVPPGPFSVEMHDLRQLLAKAPAAVSSLRNGAKSTGIGDLKV